MAGDLHKPLIELLEYERKSGYDAGRKAGIRKVVELTRNKDFYDAMAWVNPHCKGTIRFVLETIYYKLKEWEIDEKHNSRN